MRKNYFLSTSWRRLLIVALLLVVFIPKAGAQDAKISLSMKNASVKEVLRKIESMTSYRFFYSDDIPFVYSNVNADYKDTSVKDVLAGILRGSNLTYKLLDNDGIVLTPFGSTSAKVTGVVAGDDGVPLSGARVVVKGTDKGTTTNSAGAYSIELPNQKSQILQFSAMGHIPAERQVAGGTTVNVALANDLISLDEIVAIGYGSTKRRDLAGAVSSISGESIANTPVATAAEAITGRIAGVQVINTEGNPDADIIIRVRGGGSISQDNAPLYIVDGFPSDAGLAGINPSDIASIDVLKDASSTAIYGSRGANGVVIINTKRGTAGKSKVTYNGYYGVKQITRFLDVLSPYEFVMAQHEMSHNPDAGSSSADSFDGRYGTFDTLGEYRDQEGVNWQKEVFGRRGMVQNHDISLSGGSKATKYYVKYTYYDEKGIMVNSKSSRDYLKMSIDQDVFKRLSLSANASYGDKRTVGGFISGSQDKGSLGSTINYRPVNGLGGNDDDLLESVEDDWADNLTNPLVRAEAEYKDKSTKTIAFNATLKYTITNALTLSVAGGLTDDYGTSRWFDDERIRAVRLRGGPEGGIANSSKKRVMQNASLNYTKTFDKKHAVTAMVGQEISTEKGDKLEASAYKFPDALIGLNNLGLGEIAGRPSSNYYEDRLASFFGRVGYTYKDKYILTGSMRMDGSSKFSDDNKWGYFPSFQAAWRVSEEKFFKPVKAVSSLKVRFGYGQAGNNRIPNDVYRSIYTSTFYAADPLSQSVALYPSNLAYPGIKWETTITRNLGMDIGLLKGRVNVMVDVYKNNTRDLLLRARIPTSTGYPNQYKNVGSTENKGVEFVVNSLNLNKSGFTWTSDFNIAFNRGKITKLNHDDLGAQNSYLENSGWGKTIYDFVVQVGQPVGMIYGYVSDGFYTADDFTGYDAVNNKWQLKDGIPYIKGDDKISPGDMKFKWIGGQKDENGNPIITPEDDRTIIGNTNPKFIGGLNNTVRYKNIDLSVFVNFSYGNKILNANRILFVNTYSKYRNFLGEMRDRFRMVNDQGEYVTDLNELRDLNINAKTVRAVSGSTARFCYSDAVEDGSFLRINTITLGYTFPQKMLSKISIQNLRVYASAYNIYTWTNYSGYDPEVSALRSNPLTPGVDYSAYPKSFSLIFGLNVTF